MMQPFYTTSTDYSSSLKQKHKIIDVLTKSRSSILMLNSKSPDYWRDYCGEVIQMELVSEIEELLRKLKNESG